MASKDHPSQSSTEMIVSAVVSTDILIRWVPEDFNEEAMRISATLAREEMCIAASIFEAVENAIGLIVGAAIVTVVRRLK